jgi:hypothetical protein
MVERSCSSYSFFTSVLDGGEWSTSRPGERTYGTHWIGGWVGLELVWTQKLEGESFASAGDRTPVSRSSSPWSDTILTELRRFLSVAGTEVYSYTPSCALQDYSTRVFLG